MATSPVLTLKANDPEGVTGISVWSLLTMDEGGDYPVQNLMALQTPLRQTYPVTIAADRRQITRSISISESGVLSVQEFVLASRTIQPAESVGDDAKSVQGSGPGYPMAA